MAFSGPTPSKALGLALKEGLVPDRELSMYASEWMEAWVSELKEQSTQPNSGLHRPWARACDAGSRRQPDQPAPHLSELTDEHADRGIIDVLEGFLSRGHNPFGPLKTLADLGGNVLAACVALNLPSAIDLLAQQPWRPCLQELNVTTGCVSL